MATRKNYIKFTNDNFYSMEQGVIILVFRELEKALIESGVPSSHWNMADLPGIDKMSSQQICQLLK